eukprot:scaffold292256_cov28-Tisochrysis_lutea.AAC.2
MHLPSASNDELMPTASRNCCPATRDCFTCSQPAKSTSASCEVMTRSCPSRTRPRCVTPTMKSV